MIKLQWLISINYCLVIKLSKWHVVRYNTFDQLYANVTCFGFKVWSPQADRQTKRQTDRQINRQTDKQTDRQTDKQTDRQTTRWRDPQTSDGQTNGLVRECIWRWKHQGPLGQKFKYDTSRRNPLRQGTHMQLPLSMDCFCQNNYSKCIVTVNLSPLKVLVTKNCISMYVFMFAGMLYAACM